MFFHVVVLALSIPSSCALYSSSSGVIDLTPANFDSLVTNSDEVWIVEFFAPWCGHCKALVPEYQKAAKALKGVVKVGAVNADEHRTLGGRFGVQGFPTIKIFAANKNKPTDYQGARTAEGFVDVAFRELRNKVNNVLGGKSSGSGSGSKDAVIELTDGNFEELVMNSDDPWMVEFFAPWCGHCQRLAPEWASAANEMKGRVKFGALDATVHSVKASEYGIRGFPTIKFFPAGKKNKKSPEDYDGGRDSSSIVSWVSEKAVADIPPPEVKQAVSQDVVKEACEETPCVVAVLPHILDCQSKCRKEYISTLTQLGDKFKKNRWGWIWVEAGSQPALEEALELGGFGYPALAVLNPRKGKYSSLRGSFDFVGINEFLRDLSYGRGHTAPLKGGALPTVDLIEPWDGKDGAPPVVDDIDLSDVDLDDLGDVKTEL